MKRAPPIILFFIAFLIFLPLVNASAPVINSVVDFPDPVETEENITIRVNVTDLEGDIDKVLINFSSPVTDIIEMTNTTGPYTSGGFYEINYTPHFPKFYTYRIFANDSTGNSILSTVYSFEARTTAQAIISIEIAPMCGSAFSFYYVPDEVTREQYVFFLQINQNIGNMNINETSNMYVEYNNGTIFFGPVYDETVELEPWEDDLHYGIWRTMNDTPLGTYYWHGISEYMGRVMYGGNDTIYPWQEYNDTAECTEPNDTDSDGVNETECWYHFKRDCFNAYGKGYIFNTTNTSSITVPDQNTSTPTYFDTMNISGTIYYGYTFKMNNCTEYCYACISNDTTITEDECAYSTKWYDGLISNELGNLTVTEMNSDGSNVTFSKTFISCTDRYIISSCEINYTENYLVCQDYIQCNGSIEIVDDFEVVLEFGGEKEQPSPEPYPTPVPTPTPAGSMVFIAEEAFLSRSTK